MIKRISLRIDASIALALGGMVMLSSCTSGTQDYGLASTTPTSKSLVGTSSGDLTVVKRLTPPEHARDGQPNTIFKNDLLKIDFFEVTELDKDVRVDGDGRIQLPLIGYVKAEGRTIPELEAELKRRYGANYLQDPQISVFVRDSSERKIAMEGAFQHPGVFRANAQSTLMRLVARTEGVNDTADENKIFIFRKYKTGTQVAQYSLIDIRNGRAPDPRLYPRDVVVAFPSKTKIAFNNLKAALGVASSAARVVAPL